MVFGWCTFQINVGRLLGGCRLCLPTGLLKRLESTLLGPWNLRGSGKWYVRSFGFFMSTLIQGCYSRVQIQPEPEVRAYDTINRFLVNPASSFAEEDVSKFSMVCKAVTLFDRAHSLGLSWASGMESQSNAVAPIADVFSSLQPQPLPVKRRRRQQLAWLPCVTRRKRSRIR